MSELSKSDTSNSDTKHEHFKKVFEDAQALYRKRIAELLRNLARESGGTEKLSLETGIPKRTLDGYITNEAAIPGDRLSLILLILQQRQPGVISRFYEALGAGGDDTYIDMPSFRVSSEYRVQPKQVEHRLNEPQTPFGCVAIPLYRTPLSAGTGEVVLFDEVIGTRYFERDWINRAFGGQVDMLALSVARGDSMRPTIHDGDLVLIDRRDTKPARDDIYAIMIDGQQYVKRLQRRPDGTLSVISDNGAYETFTISPNALDQREVQIYGHVAWWGHTNR